MGSSLSRSHTDALFTFIYFRFGSLYGVCCCSLVFFAYEILILICVSVKFTLLMLSQNEKKKSTKATRDWIRFLAKYWIFHVFIFFLSQKKRCTANRKTKQLTFHWVFYTYTKLTEMSPIAACACNQCAYTRTNKNHAFFGTFFKIQKVRPFVVGRQICEVLPFSS